MLSKRVGRLVVGSVTKERASLYGDSGFNIKKFAMQCANTHNVDLEFGNEYVGANRQRIDVVVYGYEGPLEAFYHTLVDSDGVEVSRVE
jgi:hypothetical protein